MISGFRGAPFLSPAGAEQLDRQSGIPDDLLAMRCYVFGNVSVITKYAACSVRARYMSKQRQIRELTRKVVIYIDTNVAGVASRRQTQEPAQKLIAKNSTPAPNSTQAH